MKSRRSLFIGAVVVLACSIAGTWYFGYKYYWWIHYPSLGKTMGGPLLTYAERRLWTWGLWLSVVLGVLSLANIFKGLVEARGRGR